MLIKLEDAILKYGLQIRGVVHVGGHWGEETADYIKCGIKNIVYVEPCKQAFDVLVNKFANDHRIKLFNYAAANEIGTADIFASPDNEGQSNSLLKPAKHVAQYPTIQFTEKETVRLQKLDNMVFDRSMYNMLNMDVQGFEHQVLMGATETLKHIDVVYTEVNRDELYEGCAQIEQLDEILKDFKRVETNWGGDTWGDAIYLRV